MEEKDHPNQLVSHIGHLFIFPLQDKERRGLILSSSLVYGYSLSSPAQPLPPAEFGKQFCQIPYD